MTCVQCYGECSILRTVSTHLIDRGRYHNRLCVVQQSGGGGGEDITPEILPALQVYYQCIWGGKIDHKLHHSIDNIITVLMISLCSTDDITHLSLLLGSIVPMEVLLDFQDGSILEFGGFEIDITQDYLRTTVPLVSYIRNSLRFWYYASLSTCCQNLEKKLGSPGKFGRKRGSNF